MGAKYIKTLKKLLIMGAMSVLVAGCKRVPEPLEVPEQIPVDVKSLPEDFGMEDLKELNDGTVEIRYDAVTAQPCQIEGKFSAQRILSKEDALLALLNVRSLMGIRSYEFYCEDRDDERNELCVYFFRQLYEGIPVENGYFRVAATKEGEPVSVSGVYKEVFNVDKEPSVSYQDGKKAFSLSFGSKIASVELVICFTEENEAHLCWKYSVTAVNLADNKVIYVDAKTGEMFSERATAMENTKNSYR